MMRSLMCTCTESYVICNIISSGMHQWLPRRLTCGFLVFMLCFVGRGDFGGSFFSMMEQWCVKGSYGIPFLASLWVISHANLFRITVPFWGEPLVNSPPQNNRNMVQWNLSITNTSYDISLSFQVALGPLDELFNFQSASITSLYDNRQLIAL